MQIVINIPKEFEEHFNSDKFEDSLQRVRFDIHKAFVGNKDILSGNYEIETLDMLTEAFLNGTPLSKGYGRLGDLSKVYDKLNNAQIEGTEEYKGLGEAKQIVCDAPTIIEADKEKESEVKHEKM